MSAETPVWYTNAGTDGFVVHFSGHVTSTVRSSTQMTGVGLGIQAVGFDIDITNFAIGDYTNDKIWYMSGQYTTTVKNSVAQTISLVESVSLGLTNTLVCGSLGADHMVWFSGKVTSTIKATFRGSTQTIYPGSSSPICALVHGPPGGDRPVLWVEPSGADKRYLRLSDLFSSVIEDTADGEAIDQPANVNVVYMAYDGVYMLWASSASTAQFHKTTYFGTIHVNQSDISRPAFVGSGGIDGLSNDVWVERYVTNHPESVVHLLDFSGEGHASQTWTPVFPSQHLFNFGHTVIGGVFTVLQTIEFDATISRAGGTYNRTITDLLDLNGIGSDTKIVTADAGTITFSHSVSSGQEEIIAQTLDLSQAVIEERVSAKFEHDLQFTQSATVSGTRNKSINHELQFNVSHAAWLTSVSDCTYDPQPPRSIDFPVVPQSYIRLQDDNQSPTNIIDIRNPGFGNTESIENFRVFNTSRSRHYSVYRDSNWPQNRRLKIVSSENTLAESVTLLAFLAATLGQVIRLIDWEGRHWLGVITNPETAVQDLGGSVSTCRFQFSIDFLGELTEVNSAAQTYNRSFEHTLDLEQVVSKIRLCPSFQFQCVPDIEPPGYPSSDPDE